AAARATAARTGTSTAGRRSRWRSCLAAQQRPRIARARDGVLFLGVVLRAAGVLHRAVLARLEILRARESGEVAAGDGVDEKLERADEPIALRAEVEGEVLRFA